MLDHVGFASVDQFRAAWVLAVELVAVPIVMRQARSLLDVVILVDVVALLVLAVAAGEAFLAVGADEASPYLVAAFGYRHHAHLTASFLDEYWIVLAYNWLVSTDQLHMPPGCREHNLIPTAIPNKKMQTRIMIIVAISSFVIRSSPLDAPA
jgi:hypothetical protein